MRQSRHQLPGRRRRRVEGDDLLVRLPGRHCRPRLAASTGAHSSLTALGDWRPLSSRPAMDETWPMRRKTGAAPLRGLGGGDLGCCRVRSEGGGGGAGCRLDRGARDKWWHFILYVEVWNGWVYSSSRGGYIGRCSFSAAFTRTALGLLFIDIVTTFWKLFLRHKMIIIFGDYPLSAAFVTSLIRHYLFHSYVTFRICIRESIEKHIHICIGHQGKYIYEIKAGKENEYLSLRNEHTIRGSKPFILSNKRNTYLRTKCYLCRN